MYELGQSKFERAIFIPLKIKYVRVLCQSIELIERNGKRFANFNLNENYFFKNLNQKNGIYTKKWIVFRNKLLRSKLLY